MFVKTHTAIMQGLTPVLVEVEIEETQGLPGLYLIGLATKAVTEAKERITAALANLGIEPPPRRIVVNLAPADLPKNSSAVELAIAVGLLKLLGKIKYPTDDTLFFGELSLNGTLKPIRGALPLVMAAQTYGFPRVVLPSANQKEASLVKTVIVHPLSSLQEYLLLTKNKKPLPLVRLEKNTSLSVVTPLSVSVPDFSSIIGQPIAKRALEIAAAGGHNVLLLGPPGAGKSLLATCLPGILPPPSQTEMLEIITIHSLAGKAVPLVTERPFRSPHHTTSYVGLIGGGRHLLPGEISLAHRGVLFCDELPEFNQRALESLRQPLEEKKITIIREHGSATYPANFMFVAAANPCPCGYLDSEQKPCRCSLIQLQQYQKKLSGPLIDRIDLQVRVAPVEQKLLTQAQSARAENSDAIRARVMTARKKQSKKYEQTPFITNSDVSTDWIRSHFLIEPDARATLAHASKQLNLSARSYFRVLKVAQTIADLEGKAETITAQHVNEALQYRL